MAYKNLQEFISALEKAGELVRIKTYVNPELEITEITDRVSKQDGPALLFENTGTPFPLLINSMGSYKRMCMALGVKDMDDISQDIEALFKELTSPKESIVDKLKMLPRLGKIASWMPKVISGKGECQQVINLKPDLSQIPVMKCWPEDGGPFITLPVIHTKDPNTGIRNVGMYRMQVFDKDLTALHWHRHKVSARHFEEYKKLGKKMPVAVALGGDPVYTYAATAPLPDGIDEYMLAGFIRKKKVELVQCITQDVQVPADADIIIEGYVDPEEEFIWEGPFGDHTGYYSLPDWYPRFHVTCITHRKDAVYPSTIVGIPPQEDAWIGKATERIFLAPIKMTMVPEIMDMELPIEGVFHNLAIVQIEKSYPGQALKVMNSLWGAGQMMFTKMMVVVDQHVNIRDQVALAKYVSDNFDPEQDLVVSQGPTDVLDHSCSKMAFGGKLGIDATKKFAEELRPAYQPKPYPTAQIPDLQTIKTAYPEIAALNTSLLEQGISLIFITLKKSIPGQVKKVAKGISLMPEFSSVKVMIFLDDIIDIARVGDALWRFSNNTDVKRDHLLLTGEDCNSAEGKLILDGTRKTKDLDGFQRDWPNILISDDATVARIDEIWSQLGLGPFVPSPTLRYKPQYDGGGASVPA
jgi:4-hydroxy-3-polyprenylbenzoate decarboxylase